MTVFFFIVLHVPLGLLMQRMPAIATAHALIAFALGLWWAVSRPSADRVAYALAYIAGAEVLWRMCGAQVFWEFGKYAITAICLAALVNRRRLLDNPASNTRLPLLYFALLAPSVALILFNRDLSDVRDQLSFNLSGPVVLTASGWFFSRVQLGSSQIYRTFLALLAPIAGICAIAVTGTISASDLAFIDESNLMTSGGFGPNQVSGMLGLGALLALLCLVNHVTRPFVSVCLLAMLVVFATTSAITFSRSGLYMAIGSAMLAALYWIRQLRSQVRLAIILPLIVACATYLILPRLEELTGDALARRFQNTDMTERALLVKSDLQVWADHLVLGVGPGEGEAHRDALGGGISAHTEFSRVLAEHGLFGVAALAVLAFAAIQNVLRARTLVGKTTTIALTGWALLFLAVNAMRLAAPGFLFGLCFARLDSPGRLGTARLASRHYARAVSVSTHMRPLGRASALSPTRLP